MAGFASGHMDNSGGHRSRGEWYRYKVETGQTAVLLLGAVCPQLRGWAVEPGAYISGTEQVTGIWEQKMYASPDARHCVAVWLRGEAD